MEREELSFYMQKAPATEVSRLRKIIETRATVQLIQKPTPQTLLVPVKDPINGGEFLGGEVLVTSAFVSVDGHNGWAMVMDDSPESATSLAIIDGAIGADICVDEIMAIGERGRLSHDQAKKDTNKQASTTRVAFDLL